MSKNENLSKANKAKNDEWYTQYRDIEIEIEHYIAYNKDVFKGKTILLPCDDPEWSEFTKYFIANFKTLGIKKIISTSYAKSSGNKYISDVERKSPNFDKKKNKTNGKLFVFDETNITSSQVDYDNINFTYLNGDGDFRSDEVKKLRDEADIIITNPPFSLFREFVNWIFESKKQFLIIGSTNAITYKEFFPLLKDDKVWLGCNPVKEFMKPDKTTQKFGNICWYTNLDHEKRYGKKTFTTATENLKHNKKLLKKLKEYEVDTYPKYDNYDAIEVPFTKAIPFDYEGVMGVPITFLEDYNPNLFEIIGNEYTLNISKGRVYVNEKRLYSRIFIKKKVIQPKKEGV